MGICILVVVLVVGGVLLWPKGKHSGGSGATGTGTGSASPPVGSPAATADAFAAGWTKGNVSGVDYAPAINPAGGTSAAPSGDQVQAAYQAIVKGLQARSVSVQVGAIGASTDAGHPNADQAALNVRWQLPGDQVWSYQTTAYLEQGDREWLLDWEPDLVQPSLGAGDTLLYTRLASKRATILDGAGQPLFADRAVVDIGVEPSKTTSASATATQLAAILKGYDVSAAALAAKIAAAPGDQFVDVITLRQTDFAPVGAKVQAVPGVILRQTTETLAPSHDFARSLLGTVGPVTKQIVDASDGRYIAGDVGGLSGLQLEFDKQLGGTPGYQISVVHPSAAGSTPAPTVVAVQQPVDGHPLQTTLDQNVQNAADAAVDTVTNQPSALVAVRISTGKVVAVANGPDGGGYDAALLGQLPPGSAFKIVTTTALLEQGFNVNTPVACPPTITVQGKTFHNYEGETFATPPFHTDFAKSCNTAFISLSPKVAGRTLPTTAHALGIGACWSLGTEAYRGSVPTPATAVDAAATSFGQGQTLVSPVSLAVAVASVARGSYVAPQLVTNGEPADCSNANGVAASSSAAASSPAASASAASASGAGAPVGMVASAPAVSAALPASAMTQLRSLMREVVTSGTASVLKDAPGGLVMAKTGTAEYGPGAKPKTHAWLIGYQGDIAFAVYVQDGQSGGTVAAPVALDFLRNLS